MDLQINGKTIESPQPFINIANNFQMINKMSYNDLITIGPTLGFSDTLDNYRSVKWNGTTATANGMGFTNNKPFITNAGTAGGFDKQIGIQLTQNAGTVNGCLQYKIARYADTSAAGGAYNNVFGTNNILNTTKLFNEARPYYTVSGTNYMVWYDYAVIKLSTLLESLGNIGLVRKFDSVLRLWINTGSMNVTIANPGLTTLQYGTINANTFSNTCPCILNYLNDIPANG